MSIESYTGSLKYHGSQGGLKMAFYDKLDEKQTIKKAKTVLKEYSRFLKIVGNAYYDIGLKHVPQEEMFRSFSSYLNHDTKLLESIDRKDREYDVLNKYIKSIQSCINLLNLEEIELIKYRYVNHLTMEKIQEKFEMNDMPISLRQLRRKMNNAYIDFAVAYGIFVLKSDHQEN